MKLENSREIQFKILKSTKRTWCDGRNSKLYGKSLYGELLPKCNLKTELKICTIVYGKSDDYPEGFEVGEVVKFYINALRFNSKTIRINGEVIL